MGALTFKKYEKRKPAGNGGYSLIELAIVIVVIGILIAPFMLLYSTYRKNMAFQTTFSNVQLAIDALENYRTQTGYYPCPGPLNVPRNYSTPNATYGASEDCSTLPAAGCANGVCIEQSVRVPPLTNPRVVVGAIPFRDLQIEENQTIDGYGSRLVYTVTESMTSLATFNEANGAIAIHGQNGQPVTKTDGTVSYLVLSHGPDRVGAYSREGALEIPCPGSAVLALEGENCNDRFEGGTLESPQSIYVSSYQNNAAGPNFYDDQISYFSQQSAPLWKRSTVNTEDIDDLSPNNVGVGKLVPAVDLDISSSAANPPLDSLRVTGKLMADTISNAAGANTFTVSKLASDNAPGSGMRCAAGMYMAGIANDAPICLPAVAAVECTNPALPILVGVDASGNPICQAVPKASCIASSAAPVCSTPISLPAGANGATFTSPVVGACEKVTYKCNAGVWAFTGTSGSCVNTATTGVSCGLGFTGTYTTFICGGSTKATDCVCTGGTFPNSASCASILGAAWGGTATRTITYTPPSCAATTSPWDTSGCACATGIANGTLRWVANGSCPAGYTGAKTKEQKYSTASCAWVDTGNTMDTCACDTTPLTTASDHVCSDPVCLMPNPTDQDIFTITIDPSTCSQRAAVKTHDGSCLAKTFKWVDNGTGGAHGTLGPPYIGDSCGCTDSEAAGTVSCYYPADPSAVIHRCQCK